MKLLDNVDATLVTLRMLNDAPPDDVLNYRVAQGYQQDTSVALGDGRAILSEFSVEVVLEPLAELGGTGADIPEARKELLTHMENTRKLQVTNSVGTRSLPVALGKSITRERRWEDGKRRVTLTFVPSTKASTSTGADPGDWLS